MALTRQSMTDEQRPDYAGKDTARYPWLAGRGTDN